MSTSVEHDFKTSSQIAEASASPATVSPAALFGTWIAPSTSRNLVKIVFAASGGGITVHAFGACSPTPCDWGVVSGLVYSANVSSTQAVAFSAQYRFSFSQAIIVGHIQGKQLIVETFTHFIDGSGRDDYYDTDVMTR